MTTIMEKMEEIQKMADDLGDMAKFATHGKIYFPSEATEIELVMCGHCEKKITPNLIASFGADHHDPDETMCADCFACAVDLAESRAETI